MTTETRTLIDLADILAIQYECTHCGTKFSVPISRSIDHPMKCFNCRHEWYAMPDNYNRARFNELTRSISQATQALADLQSDGIKIHVRLEVVVTRDRLAPGPS